MSSSTDRAQIVADRARRAAASIALFDPGGRGASIGRRPHTSDHLQAFDVVIGHEAIRRASRALFADGYFARAVEEAFKCLNGAVKRRSGEPRKDGSDLMFHVFDPDLPVLRTLSRDEIEARNFDLKAVNPNAKSTEDTRTPEELLDIIEAKGHEVEAAIAELRGLLERT